MRDAADYAIVFATEGDADDLIARLRQLDPLSAAVLVLQVGERLSPAATRRLIAELDDARPMRRDGGR